MEIITYEFVDQAVDRILNAVFYPESMDKYFGPKPACHITVLIPSFLDHVAMPWKSGPRQSCRIFTKGFSKENEERRDLQEIAEKKADRLWRGPEESSSLMRILLPEEHTVPWGSATGEGMVIVCAGPPRHISDTIAKMSSAFIKGLALHVYEHGTEPPEPDGMMGLL